MEKIKKFSRNKVLTILLLLGVTFSVVTVVFGVAAVPNPGHDISTLGGYGATGDIFYGTNGTSGGVSALADVAAGSYLRSGGVGVAPLWSTITLPNAVTTGDLLYGSASNVVSALNDVATGNALISGGVGVAPSYGKIALTTHVSGILPTANGGTGIAYFTAAGPTTARVYTFPDANKTIAANDASNLALTSQAAGDLLVASGGTSYGRLAKGTANQVLAMDGTGTNLLWTTAAGGGDMTLAGIQSVTGLKTFDTIKLAIKGSGAGTTAIASSNAGATNYTLTLPASNGSVLATQWIAQAATYTLVSQTGAQKLFNQGASGTGALTVGIGVYFFECMYTLTSMSATSGNGGFALVVGGGGAATASWKALGMDNTTPGTGAAHGGSYSATLANTANLVTAGTGTAVQMNINGILRVTTAGTITPSVSLTTAAAAVVGINSYCKFEQVSPTGADTYEGNWN